MQGQEDLANLFARNLSLEPVPVAPVEEPKITYISQHYHHSAHLAQAPPNPQIQRPASEPPQPEHETVGTVLKAHGVDAAALSPSQLQLFKTAEGAQQLRLIELWRICPPTNGADNPALAWSSTTVEQEELLAKLRLERRLQLEQRSPTMSLDGTLVSPVQLVDSRWLGGHYMEPYMSSGYEQMAHREYNATAMPRSKDVYGHFGTTVGGPSYSPATDPVYKTANGGLDWARQQAMEDQYGSFQQFRNDDMEI